MVVCILLGPPADPIFRVDKADAIDQAYYIVANGDGRPIG